jgi:hypothetical protein
MMNKIPADDSEEVYSSQFITNDESEPVTVRYNALAYELKIEQQLVEEHQAQPITQRAMPKAKKPSQASPPVQ